MSVQNAESDFIEIFPISVDRYQFHNGRAFTEQNLSSILNKLSDESAYVIDYLAGEYLEFMIKGHYFKLTDDKILGLNPLYVGISFNTINPNFEQLNGQDLPEEINGTDQFKFKYVDFSSERLYTSSDTKPSSYDGTLYHYVLQLLDSEGNIPIESKYRFIGDSIKNINGGTV